MQSPLTLSTFNERLLLAYLKLSDKSIFKTPIVGLFKDGRLSLIHLCSIIRTSESIADLVKLLDKDPTLVPYLDSEGNNILHYAVYARNLHLVEAILNKFNPSTLFVQNHKLCNPMHMAVSAKTLNQLELPKMEELLLSKDKAGKMLT